MGYNIILIILSVIFLISFLLGGVYAYHRRVLRYLHYLQQDDYSPKRFLKWYWKSKTNFKIFRRCWSFYFKAQDKKVFAITFLFYLVLFVLGILTRNNVTISLSFILLSLYFFTVFFVLKKEEDPRNKAKIPLVMTNRAKQIYCLTLLVSFLIFITFITFVFVILYQDNVSTSLFITIFIIVIYSSLHFLIPLLLIFSVILLTPFEKYKQRKFINEAKEKISRVNPFIISVVGSYGKSTVKNMLGDILKSTKGNTFWPKAGINTLMGITRQIRENMKESDKYAIIEMGTYKKGSITKTCTLTPPNAVILTAINHMHLERFKTRKNIYEAKTEAIKMLPEDGILVCNADDEYSLKAYNEFDIRKKYLYGLENKGNLDAYLADISYSKEGTKAKIYFRGTPYDLKTKIVGRGGLSSLLACFTMSVALGIDPKFVIASILNIEPLSNRLVLKQYANDLIYLEDGYNSNPVGFDSALDVLKTLDVKRRIVMTPGIIELGDEQFVENYKIAKKITKICDKVIFVGDENKEAYKKAFDEERFQNVDYVKTRDEGFAILTPYQQPGDGVLIENDLPDWYEGDMSF